MCRLVLGLVEFGIMAGLDLLGSVSSNEYHVPSVYSSDTNTDEDENGADSLVENLKLDLKIAFENVYMYLVRQLRIQRDLYNFKKEHNDANVHNVLEYMQQLEKRMERVAQIYNSMELPNDAVGHHGLELSFVDIKMKDDRVPPMTEQEMEEAKRINDYCVQHFKCFCYCTTPPYHHE